MADGIAFPPSFFDRADGSNGGTPTPPSALIVAGSLEIAGVLAIEELKTSPQIEFAEQGTIRHAFKCNYEDGITLANGLTRGTLLHDTVSDLFSVVLSTSIDMMEGNFCTLTITAESINAVDTPPQEFNIEPIQFNPSILKHPRYFIFDATQATKKYYGLTPYDLYLINSQFSAATGVLQAAYQNLTSQIPSANDPDKTNSWATDAQRKAAAIELASKITLGEDTFYLPSFRVRWSEYFFLGYSSDETGDSPPATVTNPGGYIEDPTTVIPPNYWSIDGSGNPNTNILLPTSVGGAMDTSHTAQFYSKGISWLRECDSLFRQRTWSRIDHYWTGAPLGHWDGQVYSEDASPYIVFPT